MWVLTMTEYINREAIRDALYDADAITMQGVKLLNQFPATDVEPVRCGKMTIERRWAMPNKWTFCITPIKELVEEAMNIGEL